jgi:hypothetical protein
VTAMTDQSTIVGVGWRRALVGNRRRQNQVTLSSIYRTSIILVFSTINCSGLNLQQIGFQNSGEKSHIFAQYLNGMSEYDTYILSAKVLVSDKGDEAELCGRYEQRCMCEKTVKMETSPLSHHIRSLAITSSHYNYIQIVTILITQDIWIP